VRRLPYGDDQFQLSPASVEARFRLLKWRADSIRGADDPLFRPIDADDFRTNGDNAATSAISAERSRPDRLPLPARSS
jgi:hypothetical protein